MPFAASNRGQTPLTRVERAWQGGALETVPGKPRLKHDHALG